MVRNASSVNSGVNPNGPPKQDPTVRLAAKAPNGLPTTGFLFAMVDAGGGAVAGAGDFSVTLWLWSPIVQRWLSFAQKTGVAYDQLYETYDVDGGALIFVQVDNIGAPGDLSFYFCEQ